MHVRISHHITYLYDICSTCYNTLGRARIRKWFTIDMLLRRQMQMNMIGNMITATDSDDEHVHGEYINRKWDASRSRIKVSHIIVCFVTVERVYFSVWTMDVIMYIICFFCHPHRMRTELNFSLSLIKSLFYFFDFIFVLFPFAGWNVAWPMEMSSATKTTITIIISMLECMMKYVFIQFIHIILPRRFVEHTHAQNSYSYLWAWDVSCVLWMGGCLYQYLLCILLCV